MYFILEFYHGVEGQNHTSKNRRLQGYGKLFSKSVGKARHACKRKNCERGPDLSTGQHLKQDAVEKRLH